MTTTQLLQGLILLSVMTLTLLAVAPRPIVTEASWFLYPQSEAQGLNTDADISPDAVRKDRSP